MEKKRVDNFWRVIHLCTSPSYFAYLSAYFHHGIMTYVKKSKLAAAAAPVLAALISIISLPGCMLPPAACAAPSCTAGYGWPVKGYSGSSPEIIQRFKAPPKPWLSGHRGVDIRAEPGTRLYAPSDGIISFAGIVAGKNVVSITHSKGRISTFEPAQTGLAVKTHVKKGQEIGWVEGGSDHCRDICVQWGIKTGEKSYLDPEILVSRKTVVLKPVDGG